MSFGAEHESPRPPAGAGFSDAVTVAFADEAADVYGLARLGLADGSASGLALILHGGETVAARAEAAGEAGGARWEQARAAGVSMGVAAPLERWSVGFDGGAEDGFELELEALGPPAELPADSAVGAAGGMEGYEQLCRVRGTAQVDGRSMAIECLGQRGHQWGTPDWNRMDLARTVGVWLAPDLAVVLSAVRPKDTKEHGGEAVTARVLEGSPATPLEIAEPRLSTTYDGERRQRRAGFELWPTEDAPVARRGAGEVVCGTTLELGRLRLDAAFFRWRMDGREGLGRYDILRRA